MKYLCISLLLLPYYHILAQQPVIDYKARLRSYPLLPHQFFVEDTLQGRRNLSMYNAVDSLVLSQKKDSIFIDSRIIADAMMKNILGNDWPLFKSVRVRYFDRYDLDKGWEWKYDLQFPSLIRYELYNAKKMTGTN